MNVYERENKEKTLERKQTKTYGKLITQTVKITIQFQIHFLL